MPRLYSGIRFPLDRPSLENTMRIDHHALRMVHAMRTHGMYLDVDYLHEFADYLRGEENRITAEVTEMVGVRLNLASKDQLADLLFRRLNIKPRFNLKLTASGKREILDDGVLESLKSYHPVIPLLQEFNELNKLRTSFAETLPNYVDAAGRIHGDIKLTRVVTGRLAMNDPNLLGQPTRSDLGKRIRKAFKAPKGRMLIGMDLSQAQMRWAAHLAQCVNMIRVFLEGGDIHVENACMMFRLPKDKLDKMRHRYPAKRTGFGVLFLITGAGLKEQLHAAVDQTWSPQQRQAHFDYWTEDQCNSVIELWYQANWEIREWQQEQMVKARRYGLVCCPFGRPRMTPGIRSTHKHIKADAEREAANSPVVMAEVGTMKLGMGIIQDLIDDEGWDCKPLIQVHDALVMETGDSGPEYLKKMCDVYANAVPMDVPMVADGSHTRESWADL